MNGFESNTYGDAFADVYDEWYANVSDVNSTVARLAQLAGRFPHLPVLELGVGTGRLAIPLAAAITPQLVMGIDTSTAMLAQLARKRDRDSVEIVAGDMVDNLPEGPFALAFVAYNTFFGLTTAQRQSECFCAVAQRLATAGAFVVEAFVPDELHGGGDHIEVRTLQSDAVVLSISRSNADQTVDGQFVQFTEAGGVRLRPWSILPASPDALDRMATNAGLRLSERTETFAGGDFNAHSVRHVSIYVKE